MAMLAFAPSDGQQADAPQGSQPLAWGPPVPRSLHRAAETLRMRALNHCVRTLTAQGVAMDVASVECRSDLRRGNLERSPFKVAKH